MVNIKNNYKKNLLALTIGMLCFISLLLIGEAFLRVLPLRVLSGYSAPRMYEWDPVLGHKLQSDGRWVHKTPEFKVEIVTDSNGYRNERNANATKKGNVLQIGYIGDSMMFGWGVPWKDSSVNLISRLLSEERDENISIINGSVPGYGISHYQLMLTSLLEQRKVINTFIVCVFGRNDFNYRHDPQKVHVKDGLIVSESGSHHSGVRRFLSEQSRIYYLLWLLKTSFNSSGRERILPQIYQKFWPQNIQNIFDEGYEALKQMNSDALSRGTKLLVVLIPSKLEISPIYWEGQRRGHLLEEESFPSDSDMNKWRLTLAKKLQDSNVPVLDLYDELKRAEKKISGELYYIQDSHWTIEGNYVAAVAITKKLSTLLID